MHQKEHIIKSPGVLLTLLSIMLMIIQPGCRQEDQDNSAFSFAFLTDIHLQPELNATQGFLKAINKVNQLSPDFVITGGDLIMDALGVPFERADSLYDLYVETSAKLNMPVFNTLGNHEEFGFYPSSGVGRAHPLYGDKLFEAKLGRRYYAFDHKHWRFYVLDCVEEKEEGGYFGYIDEEQLAWLEKDLSSVDPATPIAISVHIPMVSVQAQLNKGSTTPNNPGSVITNSTDVLGLFRKHNLKLVLQGHSHMYDDIYAGGIRFITAGAVCGRWWKGPNWGLEEGFLMIRIKGDEFTTEYVDYGWEVRQ